MLWKRNFHYGVLDFFFFLKICVKIMILLMKSSKSEIKVTSVSVMCVYMCVCSCVHVWIIFSVLSLYDFKMIFHLKYRLVNCSSWGKGRKNETEGLQSVVSYMNTFLWVMFVLNLHHCSSKQMQIFSEHHVLHVMDWVSCMYLVLLTTLALSM